VVVIPTAATSRNATFERIARRCAADPRITRGTMLVSEGLRVDGRFFVALVGESLLVKLPRTRVDELVAAGLADRFESGKGRVMKEWALVSPSAKRRWSGLASEALAFVDEQR
jgi:hypothetical protein